MSDYENAEATPTSIPSEGSPAYLYCPSCGQSPSADRLRAFSNVFFPVFRSKSAQDRNNTFKRKCIDIYGSSVSDVFVTSSKIIHIDFSSGSALDIEVRVNLSIAITTQN